MFFSIITPTCNSELSIQKTIQSVVVQKFESYEHIIIDNISKDKTLEIIKKEQSDKIKIISESDQGIYQAMNKGVKNSQGYYLLFLNSDDSLIDTNFLKNVYSILSSHEYDILYSNIIYQKNFLEINRKYVSGDFKDNLHKLGWHIPHPGSVIKKNFLVDSGYFSEEYKISSDFDFFIRAQANKKCKFYYYNFFSVKMSLGGASSGLKNIFKSNVECFKSLRKNNIERPLLFIFAKLLRKFFQLF